MAPTAWRTWYFVMAAPPVLAGAAQASRTCASPAVAVNDCGAPGAMASTGPAAALVRVSALFAMSVKPTSTLMVLPPSASTRV